MPLIKGTSQKSFVKNLKTEMEHGKPQNQSLAIAYAMKRKAQKKKMAEGGDVQSINSDPQQLQSVSDSFKKAVHSYAEGGDVNPSPTPRPKTQSEEDEETRKMLNDMPAPMAHGGEASAMEEDDMDFNQHYPDMNAETSMEEEDLVDRIMHQRKKMANGGYMQEDKMYPHAKDKMFDVTNKYSEGGKVANQDEIEAGFSPNEFDVLHLEDGLESTYGEDDNAGDALGNVREDEDRKDIVARIMASRRKERSST